MQNQNRTMDKFFKKENVGSQEPALLFYEGRNLKEKKKHSTLPVS